MILTKKEAVQKHRELWTKIAEITTSELLEGLDGSDGETKVKRIALKLIGETGYIYNCCYCCEYASYCKDCPVRWTYEKYGGPPCCEGEYGKWFHVSFIEKNVEKSKELALIIANLPETEEQL